MNLPLLYSARATVSMGDIDKIFELPDITPATMIFIGVLVVLFAFFVFLFFSWHTAVFYIGEKEYSKVSAPFMKDIPLPIPEAEEGMRFVGWYKDNELTEEYLKDHYTVKLFDVSFYAKFETLSSEEEPGEYSEHS